MKLQSVECLDRGNEYLGGHAAGVWDAMGAAFVLGWVQAFVVRTRANPQTT
jgi:hypothetical protein